MTLSKGGLEKICLGTPTLVLTADKISAFFRRGILDAWGIRLAGECTQERLCPFQLSLPFGVPPALLLTHQLNYLWAQQIMSRTATNRNILRY